MSQVTEILKNALAMEYQAQVYYREASQSARDAISASIFASLAQDEEYHEALIRRYYEAMEVGKHWPVPEGDQSPSVAARARVMEIVRENRPARPNPDFLSTYESALEMETRARRYYEEQFEAAEDADSRAFFLFLKKLEDAHVHMLEMLVEYMRSSEGDKSGKGKFAL